MRPVPPISPLPADRVLTHARESAGQAADPRLKYFLSVRAVDLAIGIEERQSQLVSKIDCDKPDRQKSGVDLLPALSVLVNPLRRIASRYMARGIHLMLADRCESVVGGQKNIGVRGKLRIGIDVVQDLFQILSAFLRAAFDVGPLIPGDKSVQAIALKMLRSVRIA